MNVARPYAEAVFDAAGGPEVALGVAAELDLAIETLGRERELQSFFNHPGVPLASKLEVVRRVFGPRESGIEKSPASRLTLNLLRLLVEKRRFGELAGVAAALRERIDDALGEGQARVEVTRPLSDAEAESVVAALERRTGKKVRLVAEVRPELIGGMRVIFRDQVLDGSVRSQLERLRRGLAGRN